MSRRRQHARPCPTPSKVAFDGPDDAREAYIAELADPTRFALPVAKIAGFAYRCPCGRWHRASFKGIDGVAL